MVRDLSGSQEPWHLNSWVNYFMENPRKIPWKLMIVGWFWGENGNPFFKPFQALHIFSHVTLHWSRHSHTLGSDIDPWPQSWIWCCPVSGSDWPPRFVGRPCRPARRINEALAGSNEICDMQLENLWFCTMKLWNKTRKTNGELSYSHVEAWFKII